MTPRPRQPTDVPCPVCGVEAGRACTWPVALEPAALGLSHRSRWSQAGMFDPEDADQLPIHALSGGGTPPAETEADANPQPPHTPSPTQAEKHHSNDVTGGESNRVREAYKRHCREAHRDLCALVKQRPRGWAAKMWGWSCAVAELDQYRQHAQCLLALRVEELDGAAAKRELWRMQQDMERRLAVVRSSKGGA